MKIMIVDDEPTVRRLTSKRLELLGYETDSIESGTLALNKLNNGNNYDLILLDEVMPEMNGLETMAKIQEHLSPPPVIMVTAHSSLHLAIEFMKIGGADFVEKPIDYDVLDVRIQKTIANNTLHSKLIKTSAEQQASAELAENQKMLIDSISHQFRTPLNSIRGASQSIQGLVECNKINTQDLNELSSEIDCAVEDLVKLTDDVLRASEAEINLFPKYTEVDLKEIAEMAIVQSNIFADTKILQITSNIQEDSSFVFADFKFTLEVVKRLLDNSIKFSDGGEITISSKREDNDVIVSIVDQGGGIPENKLKEIFIQFKQIDNSGTKPGAGLGLYICEKLIHSMDGRIWAVNNSTKGCSFHFTLKHHDR